MSCHRLKGEDLHKCNKGNDISQSIYNFSCEISRKFVGGPLFGGSPIDSRPKHAQS